MRVAILDDWHDTIRQLPCYSKLAPFDVTVFNDHVEDTDVLAKRLEGVDVLVLIRERTQVRRPLIERLPQLRLISQRSVWPHIDVQACTENGVMVSE
jgi:D-3-phosphoglycerate dehydrogenase